MTTTIERIAELKQPATFESVLRQIPDAIKFAKLEAETSNMATTPEGKFTISYLLAAQKVLKPILTDALVGRDLLVATGGPPHNPQRTIDDIGTIISSALAQDMEELPHLWIWTKEHGRWDPAQPANGFWENGNRFAVVDPLDMTSAILKGDRLQTTGLAIYDKTGELKTLGMVSLVDDGFLFMEKYGDTFRIFPPEVTQPGTTQPAEHNTESGPLRVAAKTRRMYVLKDLPIMKDGNMWVMDCDSGYAVLGLTRGTIDTVIDPIKGQPWYEFVIWHRAAQELGLPVTDPDGNTIDTAAIVRKAITDNPGEVLRIPFVMSRTPEIHQRVLPLLQHS